MLQPFLGIIIISLLIDIVTVK